MNLSPHRQAVLIFGIIIPLFCILVISIATFIGNSKLKKSYNDKVAAIKGLCGMSRDSCAAANSATAVRTCTRQVHVVMGHSPPTPPRIMI